MGGAFGVRGLVTALVIASICASWQSTGESGDKSPHSKGSGAAENNNVRNRKLSQHEFACQIGGAVSITFSQRQTRTVSVAGNLHIFEEVR